MRSTFLPSLNDLLAALALPFALDHPTDLTPSLLLAIFESLICARLPIPSSVRQSRTRDAKARAMLVLLGVLECDVLRGGTTIPDDSVMGGAGGVSVDGWVDEIGLGEVDPERLADGGWEETIFVGELLCWLARRKGILPRTKSSDRSSHPRSLYSNHHSYGTEGDTADFSTSLLLQPSSSQKSRSPRPPSPIDGDLSHITDVPRHPLVHSPEPSLSLSASTTTGTDLSIRARSVSSRTSMPITHDDPDEFEEASQDTIQAYDPRRMIQDAEEDEDRPPTFRPQCIHELEDPSYIRALAGPSSSFDPSASHDHVSEDEEDELSRGDVDAEDPYGPPTPTPRRVRLTGWIEPVDAATELSQFAASRTFNASAGSSLVPRSMSRLKTVPPRLRPGSSKPLARTSRPSSPSPSPPASSKYPPARAPPSPPADPDPPFDISFSTLNNTSTPAKPRPPRRLQLQTMTAPDSRAATMDKGKSVGSRGTVTATESGGPPLRHRDRSPSYTPSPPLFSTPSTGGTPGTKAGTSVPKTRPTPLSAPTTGRRSNRRSMSPTPTSANTKGRSPPPGSTMTTSTLLTERARLLTELAALKRARAASGVGTGMRTGTGTGTGTGTETGGVVGRRVGVGV